MSSVLLGSHRYDAKRRSRCPPSGGETAGLARRLAWLPRRVRRHATAALTRSLCAVRSNLPRTGVGKDLQRSYLLLGAATLRTVWCAQCPVSLGTDRIAQTVLRNSQTPCCKTKKNELTMRKVDESKQPDLWTWIVIGLVFSAVTAALYGPFLWEHWVI
jgi:hypothetical protein